MPTFGCGSGLRLRLFQLVPAPLDRRRLLLSLLDRALGLPQLPQGLHSRNFIIHPLGVTLYLQRCLISIAPR